MSLPTRVALGIALSVVVLIAAMQGEPDVPVTSPDVMAEERGE